MARTRQLLAELSLQALSVCFRKSVLSLMSFLSSRPLPVNRIAVWAGDDSADDWLFAASTQSLPRLHQRRQAVADRAGSELRCYGRSLIAWLRRRPGSSNSC
jgi:hypothetical protein